MWDIPCATLFEVDHTLTPSHPPGPLPFPNSEFRGGRRGRKGRVLKRAVQPPASKPRFFLLPAPRAAAGRGKRGGAGRCNAQRVLNASGKKSCTWRDGSIFQGNWFTLWTGVKIPPGPHPFPCPFPSPARLWRRARGGDGRRGFAEGGEAACCKTLSRSPLSPGHKARGRGETKGDEGR